MYYILYLASTYLHTRASTSVPFLPPTPIYLATNKQTTGLCRRRHWPEPIYSAYPGPGSSGYTCTVRVNNREYQTDVTCTSETLARESAAMRAYLICRNFSVNDGMYPAGHDHGGVVQGIPVAIGTGRGKSRFAVDEGLDTDGSLSTSGESRSGGSSPESYGIGRRLRERDGRVWL